VQQKSSNWCGTWEPGVILPTGEDLREVEVTGSGSVLQSVTMETENGSKDFLVSSLAACQVNYGTYSLNGDTVF